MATLCPYGRIIHLKADVYLAFQNNFLDIRKLWERHGGRLGGPDGRTWLAIQKNYLLFTA
jgi:hypothetical protein